MEYNYSSPPNYFTTAFDADWEQQDARLDEDTSIYLYDSPQPESRQLPPQSISQPANSTPQAHNYHTNSAAYLSAPPNAQHLSSSSTSQTTQPSSNLVTAQPTFTVASSSSGDSEHSSSSHSSVVAQRKRKVSSASTPPDTLPEESILDEQVPSNAYKMEDGYDENLYQYGGSAFSTVGQANPGLTLNTNQALGSAMDFGRGASDSPDYSANYTSSLRQDYASRTFASLNNFHSSTNASPVRPQGMDADLDESLKNTQQRMTVQPSQTTFMLSQSREESPMLASHESSPGSFLNNASPYASGVDILGGGFSGLSPGNDNQMTSPMNMDLSSPDGSATTPPKDAEPKVDHGAKWPCRLTIGPTPEKSRVETQIPIELTLYDVPQGFDKVHLPAHTISKPKFQCKPPHESSYDTLELSVMLVCASAMEKDGLEAKAFDRAAADEGFVENDENQPASVKAQADDNDPTKPLNGGPVAICSGCITRERKRAARKKTKKQDEEDEWAKDEAKRVIVFNCAEIRDWCVPDSKDIPVKDYDGSLSTMYVKAPMRIACYCRHQTEKVGFQVIFTVRTAGGAILAQAISKSIMITDDHKQPSANQNMGLMFQQGMAGGQMFGNGAYPIYPGDYHPQAHQNLPFRTSYSTNDLTQFNRNQYNPQRHPSSFARQASGYGSTVASTAATTPRNLSRPASPTNESGPSNKKRRSGSGHAKIPTGLTMTKMENFSPTSAPHATSSQNNSQMAGGYGFAPHGFGAAAGGYQAKSPSNTFTSQPATPIHGSMQTGFGTLADPHDFTFYSAPTSQHASRVPSRAQSPASAARSQKYSNGMQQGNDPNALSLLPHGFNFDRPPMINKAVPNFGHVTGGEDVTILGEGFYQGLTVMFGDIPCEPYAYWGHTALVCKVPPALEEGQVAVLFQHQHPHFAKDLRGLRSIMPTTHVLYTYLDDDRQQMQQLAQGMNKQSLGM